MNTILVPTDYSEISLNAAIYAIHLAQALQVKNIVFYNAYQTPPVLTETAVPVMPVMDIETIKSISEQSMSRFRTKLNEYNTGGIKLEDKTDFSNLSEDINSICEQTTADLIVMGIAGTSKIEEVLVGSTALNVIKQTKVPVIIVPAEAKFTGINNVMLACDFKKVVETTPVQPIKRILDSTKASLFIAYVYEDKNNITAATTYQQELLQVLLKEYDPHFRFENSAHFMDGINHFVEANNIDLIIAIPRKHKLFEGLFKERHAKKLAFHSHVPLMYIHNEDL